MDRTVILVTGGPSVVKASGLVAHTPWIWHPSPRRQVGTHSGCGRRWRFCAIWTTPTLGGFKRLYHPHFKGGGGGLCAWASPSLARAVLRSTLTVNLLGWEVYEERGKLYLGGLPPWLPHLPHLANPNPNPNPPWLPHLPHLPCHGASPTRLGGSDAAVYRRRIAQQVILGAGVAVLLLLLLLHGRCCLPAPSHEGTGTPAPSHDATPAPSHDATPARIGKKAAGEELQVVGWMRGIVGAITYCHRHHIVHGDLKPENFVFTDKGQQSAIKLIDFGISLRTDAAQAKKRGLRGSLAYLAPEMLEGRVVMASDMWSLGVIAYGLLAGSLPFEGDTDGATRSRIQQAQVRFPPGWWRGKSPASKPNPNPNWVVARQIPRIQA
jgi:hypothetical protein